MTRDVQVNSHFPTYLPFGCNVRDTYDSFCDFRKIADDKNVLYLQRLIDYLLKLTQDVTRKAVYTDNTAALSLSKKTARYC